MKPKTYAQIAEVLKAHGFAFVRSSGSHRQFHKPGHRAGILAHFTDRPTNAICDEMNSMVQAAKRKARGFRTYEGFAAMICLVAGKLQLDTLSPFSHFH